MDIGGCAPACAWLAEVATGPRRLGAVILGAFAAGVVAVASARALPVYRAQAGARLADGSSIAGAIVWIEELWPLQPDRLHILRGNARVERGVVLAVRGGRPVAYLRGH